MIISFKKVKKLKILLIVLLLLVSFSSIQYKSQLNAIKEMHEVNLSPNPKATEYFMKAMNVNIYIRKLHSFVDFDSFLMKPLLDLQDSYLEEGKKLLKNGTSEYIFFWTLLNREIYAITVDGYEKDFSLAVTKLDANEYKKFNDKLYKLILEYLDLKKDFNYDSDYVKGTKFAVAENLVTHFSTRYAYQFQGKKIERLVQNLKDEVSIKKLEKIYSLFKIYGEKYLQYSRQKNENEMAFSCTLIRIIVKIYYAKQYRLKSRQISKEACFDIKTKDLLENLNKLLPYKNNKHRGISSLIFNKNQFTYKTVKMLDNSCDNLKEDTKKILALF